MKPDIKVYNTGGNIMSMMIWEYCKSQVVFKGMGGQQMWWYQLELPSLSRFKQN